MVSIPYIKSLVINHSWGKKQMAQRSQFHKCTVCWGCHISKSTICHLHDKF